MSILKTMKSMLIVCKVDDDSINLNTLKRQFKNVQTSMLPLKLDTEFKLLCKYFFLIFFLNEKKLDLFLYWSDLFYYLLLLYI